MNHNVSPTRRCYECIPISQILGLRQLQTEFKTALSHYASPSAVLVIQSPRVCKPCSARHPQLLCCICCKDAICPGSWCLLSRLSYLSGRESAFRPRMNSMLRSKTLCTRSLRSAHSTAPRMTVCRITTNAVMRLGSWRTLSSWRSSASSFISRKVPNARDKHNAVVVVALYHIGKLINLQIHGSKYCI